MKFELTKEFLQEIIDKIDRQEFELIKTELSELHNVDIAELIEELDEKYGNCLLYTSPSPRDLSTSRMPSSA